jgi:hypothetical protein
LALERGNLDEEVSSLSLAESKQFLFCFLLFVFRTGDESEVTVKVSVVSKDAAEKLVKCGQTWFKVKTVV